MDILSKTEKIALQLIREDLVFLNTVYQTVQKIGDSYFIALLPYIGLIIHGSESWLNKVNTFKVHAPKFSKQEKQYYTELRASIKLWETPFEELYDMLKVKYDESDRYFSHCCKPIAKILNLYDIYGTYLLNGVFCDNTILDMLFVPRFEIDHIDGEHIKNMSIFSGKIIRLFDVANDHILETSSNIKFETKDYGGFVKSPVGNTFNDKFVLFSILCAINFVLYGVEEYIIPQTPTKLRLAYLQYHYILEQLPQINAKLHTDFQMNREWTDPEKKFRNCMAHYGLATALPNDEVVETDIFGGLTERYFQMGWLSFKAAVVEELYSLSLQLKTYLRL